MKEKKQNKLSVRELVNKYQTNCDRIGEIAEICISVTVLVRSAEHHHKIRIVVHIVKSVTECRNILCLIIRLTGNSRTRYAVISRL